MESATSLRRSFAAASALLVAACGGGTDTTAVSPGRFDTVPTALTTAPAPAAPGTPSSAVSVLDEPVSGDVHTVGGLLTSVGVLRPTLASGNPKAIFLSAVELPDGTVLATGVDNGLDGSGTDSAAIWRSRDGGATFDRLDLGHPTDLQRTVEGLAQHGGIAYLFGHDAGATAIAKVWSSGDAGDTWDEQLVSDGLVSWGGIIGGRPTIATAGGHPAGGRTVAAIHQLRDGVWQRASTPDAGDAAFVWFAADLPNGSALAVGERCESDPGYRGPGSCTSGKPDATVDSLAWVSHDGGATWLDESPWLGGAPGSQSAGAVGVVGDAALIGIIGSTTGADSFTIVMNSTIDGAGWSGFGTMPAWNGGADRVWFEEIAPLGTGVMALLSTTSDDRTRPLVLVHDTATGAQELIELAASEPIRLFDLVTIAGTVHGVGATSEGGSVVPVLVAFDVLA